MVFGQGQGHGNELCKMSISDLSELLPEPIPKHIDQLVQIWSDNVNKISTDETAVTAVSEKIDTSRKEVLESIRYLR